MMRAAAEIPGAPAGRQQPSPSREPFSPSASSWSLASPTCTALPAVPCAAGSPALDVWSCPERLAATSSAIALSGRLYRDMRAPARQFRHTLWACFQLLLPTPRPRAYRLAATRSSIDRRPAASSLSRRLAAACCSPYTPIKTSNPSYSAYQRALGVRGEEAVPATWAGRLPRARKPRRDCDPQSRRDKAAGPILPLASCPLPPAPLPLAPSAIPPRLPALFQPCPPAALDPLFRFVKENLGGGC